MNEKEYDKKISQALELRNVGKPEESLSILSSIYEDIPVKDNISLGLVGSLFREANELSKALYCFDKAVESDPLSPSASLGLFHSLWRLGRYDEAFDELERFLAISKSEEHSMLLEEMREGFWGNTISKSGNPLRLIKKMRDDLYSGMIENTSE